MHIGGETQIPEVTSEDLKRYIVWKTTEYVTIRRNGERIFVADIGTKD